MEDKLKHTKMNHHHRRRLNQCIFVSGQAPELDKQQNNEDLITDYKVYNINLYIQQV